MEQYKIFTTTRLSLPYYRIPRPVPLRDRLEGNPDGKLLVVVDENDMSDNVQLLQRILSATGFDMERDIATLRIGPEDQFALASSDAVRTGSTILCFGVDPAQLGFSGNLRADLARFEHCTLLKAQSLGAIAGNERLKRQLWGNLKELFDL